MATPASATDPSARPRSRRRRANVSSVLAGLLFVCLALPAAAQNSPRPMRFERLSIEDGLSQTVVNCVVQDAAGFLWLGTQAGLNRYDGYRFEVFRNDPEDPASLPHDWIMDLAVDPSGDLWIGTEGGGLARWHRESDSFSRYRHDPEDPRSLGGDRILTLTRDRAGSLWVGTLESGLSRLDPETGTFERFRHDPSDPDSLADDWVSAVYQDARGNLWVGTQDGLDLFDAARRTFVHFRSGAQDPRTLSDNRVSAIVEDRSGTLWIGTQNGLNRFTPGPGEPRLGAFQRYLHESDGAPAAQTSVGAPPARRNPERAGTGTAGSLSHDFVRSLFEDRDGRLWIGTDGGLNLWQEATANFTSYRAAVGDSASLSNDQVVDIYQDSSGILWIGTLGGGLSKWNPGRWSFAHYWNDDEAASNTVFAISEDRAGDLWIGTLGGLERLDRAAGKRIRYRHDPGDRSSLADDRVTALLHDRQGTLWVGTVGGGLNRLHAPAGSIDGGTLEGSSFERHVHDPRREESLSADAVTTLYEDRRGRLWVGTYGGGLNLYRGGNDFAVFRHDPADGTSLGNDRVFGVAEDPAGMLWLATDGGGLNRLHLATGAFLRVEHDPASTSSLASNDLLAVHVDAQGRLWIGTKSSGLDRFESFDEATGSAIFEHFTMADGLPDPTISAILSEPDGSLWLSTNNGLARLDPLTRKIKSYTVNHGLQSNEFNQGAYFRSPSGELFFGGVGGLNAFFPDLLEANRQVPAIVLTSFSKIDRAVRLERPIFDVEQIALDHRDYLFSFEVAALDFTAPHENRYRYRLEGLDADWIELGNRRRMTFTNLDAGRYTLRVQGANHDGMWNQEGATLHLDVAPAPWHSWWAYTLYALAAAGLAGGFVRRQRHEVETERAATRREREIARRERAQSEERRRLLEELGAKNEELARFNYTVSHDLKSPLVTIKGFLGMLRQDAKEGNADRLEHDVRRIGAAADRMSRLLDELLELSSLGRKVRPPEEVALARLASEALENLVTQVAEKRVEVVVDPRLPSVVGDRVRLLQLVQNLLANSIKYMGDQSAPRVEFGMRQDAEDSVLYVRDNGLGIDQRYHEKVFGLFERLDAADDGTGVGLALAKRIVEMHGGRIWVESEGLGHGSSFCFILGDLLLEDGEEAAGAGSNVVEAGDRFRQT